MSDSSEESLSEEESDSGQESNDGGQEVHEVEVVGTITTFSITIDAPDSLIDENQVASTLERLINFFVSKAYAADGDYLEAENFGVVTIDPAGAVVDEIEITNLEKQSDGRWQINVSTHPRLDQVVVVNLNDSVNIAVGADLPSDTLFAPTTQTDVEVDIGSTSAYRNFIQALDAQEDATFESLGYDVDDAVRLTAVAAIVERVQDVIDEQINTGTIETETGDLTSILNAADTAAEPVVEEELENVKDSASGTLAELFENGGGEGYFYFETDYNSGSRYLEVDRYQVPNAGSSLSAHYDKETQAWTQPSQYDTTTSTPRGHFILTSNGWKQAAHSDELLSLNTTDGSVNIMDASIDSLRVTLSASQTINLEGRNIENFVTGDLGSVIESDATFKTDALAFRLTREYVNDTYLMWFDDGDKSTGACDSTDKTAVQLGGNCNTAHFLRAGIKSGLATDLSTLLSDTAADVTDREANDSHFIGAVVATLDRGYIVAELVDGETKLANYYIYNTDNESYTSLGTSSWSMLIPSDLTNAAAEEQLIILLPLNRQVISAGRFNNSSEQLVFAVKDGYVRSGAYYPAGSVKEDPSDWVYNSTANSDILSAVDFVFQDQYRITESTQSVWDFDLYDGTGGTITPETAYSYKAFDRLVALHSNFDAREYAFTAEEVSGSTIHIDYYDDAFVMNADGSKSPSLQNSGLQTSWSISDKGYLIITVYDDDLTGTSGATYQYVYTSYYAKSSHYDPNGSKIISWSQTNIWHQFGPEGPGSEPSLNEHLGELWWDYISVKSTE